MAGRKKIVERLWREFFSDPSKWWDNRPEKVNPRYPDFKHKKTQHSLWLIDNFKPPWVEAQLAAMAPGTLQVDLFTWNKRLKKYVNVGEYKKTIQLFKQMQQEGTNPNVFTFVSVLNACSKLGALSEGRCIHLQIIKGACEADVYVASSLLNMYANCGSIEDAWRVFNKMPKKDVVAWSAMILGYVKCGKAQKALELSRQMRWEGVEPNSITFAALLNACVSTVALEEGRDFHKQILEKGCESDVFVASSLINMYCKCGAIVEALRVFEKIHRPDVVAWSTMILGFVKCGEGQKALELFRQMQQEGVRPDPVTFVGLLNACASVVALEDGRHIHEQIINNGYESNVFVGNSLVDMYAKCGSIADAWEVFRKMPERNTVGWSALILGYVRCGEGQKALELFRQMNWERVEPNSVTFVGVLNACASVGALEEGKGAHKQIIERGSQSEPFVAISLVDMYAKCGSIEDAQGVFTSMPARNLVAWNTMLAGFAIHGHAKEAIKHFEKMSREGVEMDGITFVSLLLACSYGGLVDEGLHFLDSMSAIYSLAPTLKHYACLVDLLGRAGHLHEAENLVKVMWGKPDVNVLRSLLGACRVYGNVEMGEWVAKRVIELDRSADGSLGCQVGTLETAMDMYCH